VWWFPKTSITNFSSMWLTLFRVVQMDSSAGDRGPTQQTPTSEPVAASTSRQRPKLRQHGAMMASLAGIPASSAPASPLRATQQASTSEPAAAPTPRARPKLHQGGAMLASIQAASSGDARPLPSLPPSAPGRSVEAVRRSESKSKPMDLSGVSKATVQQIDIFSTCRD
jgi:hypothetical protein